MKPKLKVKNSYNIYLGVYVAKNMLRHKMIDAKKFDEIMDEEWISANSLKKASSELKSLIEFNLYGEGWDDQSIKQFIDETVDKVFGNIKEGDNNER